MDGESADRGLGDITSEEMAAAVKGMQDVLAKITETNAIQAATNDLHRRWREAMEKQRRSKWWNPWSWHSPPTLKASPPQQH
jgi:hypothetical protein